MIGLTVSDITSMCTWIFLVYLIPCMWTWNGAFNPPCGQTPVQFSVYPHELWTKGVVRLFSGLGFGMSRILWASLYLDRPFTRSTGHGLCRWQTNKFLLFEFPRHCNALNDQTMATLCRHSRWLPEDAVIAITIVTSLICSLWIRLSWCKRFRKPLVWTANQSAPLPFWIVDRTVFGLCKPRKGKCRMETVVEYKLFNDKSDCASASNTSINASFGVGWTVWLSTFIDEPVVVCESFIWEKSTTDQNVKASNNPNRPLILRSPTRSVYGQMGTLTVLLCFSSHYLGMVLRIKQFGKLEHEAFVESFHRFHNTRVEL